ncbi:MAG: hypothetical protein ACYDA8_02985 [Deferrisomatales bacterium]
MCGGWRQDSDGDFVFVPGDEPTPEQRVGVFWVVDDVVVGDGVPLAEAEQDGAVLRYGCHRQYWERLVPSTPAEHALKAAPYDTYPRGRTVFLGEAYRCDGCRGPRG